MLAPRQYRSAALKDGARYLAQGFGSGCSVLFDVDFHNPPLCTFTGAVFDNQ